MPISEEIERAAQELARALNETPAVQRYRAAAALAAQDETLRALEASLAQLHDQLAAREKNGEVLSRAELNQYHNLREQVRRSPLYAAREEALREVKRSFGRASQALSSALTVDFNTLAREK